MLKCGILEKKKQFGGFRVVGLIDLPGGLHYKQAVVIWNLRIVSASWIYVFRNTPTYRSRMNREHFYIYDWQLHVLS